MKSFEIIARNLESLYKATGLNSSRFCKMCKDSGINLAPSTLSRLLNGGNTSLETIDALVAGINLLPGYDKFTPQDLLTDKYFIEQAEKPALNSDNLSKFYTGLFMELDELGWLKLNTDVSMQSIVDLSVHSYKKAGFDLAISPKGSQARLRSGS